MSRRPHRTGGGSSGNVDSFSHTTYEQRPGAGTRIKNSLTGLMVGPVLIFVGCALLWFNEGWAIQTHRSLNEGLDNYIPLAPSALESPDSSSLDPYQNRLVHLSGDITVDDPASDPTFGLTRKKAISVSRKVEIYQWKEHHRTSRRKLSNGETEVQHHYDYEKKWVPEPIDSSRFHHPAHHENFGSLSYASETFKANGVKVAGLFLHQSLMRSLKSSTTVAASEATAIPASGKVSGNFIFFPQVSQSANVDNQIETKTMAIDGEDRTFYVVKSTGESFSTEVAARKAALRTQRSGGDQVGDVRVSFTEIPCTLVSILARLQHNMLSPWPSKIGPGYDVGILATGYQTAEEMISQAQSENTIKTWFLRILGWVLCWIGYAMITSIITTTADITLNWIPLLGPMASSVISLGVSIANFILATCTFLPVAAIAWLVYRPVLGVAMLVGSIGLFYLASSAGKKSKTP